MVVSCLIIYYYVITLPYGTSSLLVESSYAVVPSENVCVTTWLIRSVSSQVYDIRVIIF